MPRRSRLSRMAQLLAALFLLVAAGEALLAAAPLADPAFLTGRVDCTFGGCRFRTEPLRLVADGEGGARPAVDAEAVSRLIGGGGGTRLLLVLAAAASRLSQALLFACLALALRRLGGAQRFGPEALLWLRRAATAALVAVLAQPFSDTLRASALTPLFGGRLHLFILFDGPAFLRALLLAGGVWVCVRALEEARRVEAELAEIV